jgi:hypothetical protein
MAGGPAGPRLPRAPTTSTDAKRGRPPQAQRPRQDC